MKSHFKNVIWSIGVLFYLCLQLYHRWSDVRWIWTIQENLQSAGWSSWDDDAVCVKCTHINLVWGLNHGKFFRNCKKNRQTIWIISKNKSFFLCSRDFSDLVLLVMSRKYLLRSSQIRPRAERTETHSGRGQSILPIKVAFNLPSH